MTPLEVARLRALMQAPQKAPRAPARARAEAPPRRAPGEALWLSAPLPVAAPPPASSRRFGRRSAPPAAPEATGAGAAEAITREADVGPPDAPAPASVPANRWTETADAPFHPEDLCDAPADAARLRALLSVHLAAQEEAKAVARVLMTPAPATRWTPGRPAAARTRLLLRLASVCEAERQGLDARRAAASG